ncbi:CDP-glycerol--glycerophosphate glycerophosphotransferase [Colwellia psychrerythraea]|uniref:CDP-glycerol:poly(Glycerophosphate) glycerophosphotransferase n=1 Tax=Colwellia psychrerythraea TaxID=28229 RepID=A0A099KY27_COLPS|nr:CDP-glycerol--glycerophosphate glycerophosphotransferase [Colwellia psychrerythraea]KGJ95511.1 CDP-glycerol:poly(glycerophosphate) glycerophosphotransferase [Colwellia psychrerythraea]
MTVKRYLFYIAHNYSFEILRPLQRAILAQGDEVKWLAIGREVNLSYFQSNESVLNSIDDARAYNPDASFAPGNEIPNFIPGLKVQVFHGLEWKKKGHFVIRDFFDLYCTHGPATTSRFNVLAKKHGFFDVVETAWPKLDYLFTSPSMPIKEDLHALDKKIILYAPTFSPTLTSAPALFDEIKRLSEQKNYHWLIKFHPKMATQWLEQYKTLVKDNLQIIESSSINELLQTADIMVSDTSSVIGEFSLLNKVTVSLNNKEPGDYLVNIDSAGQLESAIKQALNPSKKLKAEIKAYADDLHPYHDGQAAQRILSATENILTNGKQATKRKPLNLFRNLKQRKKLKYWTI